MKNSNKKSSGVNWSIVTNILDCTAPFSMSSTLLALTEYEDGGRMLLQNVGNYPPVDTA
jgi:hypothetical protein